MAVYVSEDEGKSLETDEAKFYILKTKLNLLYMRNQSVPRCKHFPPQFQKPIS
jgi:hypothetical protein